jgi:hypothetical protein
MRSTARKLATAQSTCHGLPHANVLLEAQKNCSSTASQIDRVGSTNQLASRATLRGLPGGKCPWVPILWSIDVHASPFSSMNLRIVARESSLSSPFGKPPICYRVTRI